MAIAEAEVQERTVYPGMPITEDELMRLPRDGRKWEMEDGRLTEVPTSIKHEEIGINIIALFLPFSRGRGILTGGQGGFRMKDGNVRAPDVSFTRKERFPADMRRTGLATSRRTCALRSSRRPNAKPGLSGKCVNISVPAQYKCGTSSQSGRKWPCLRRRPTRRRWAQTAF